MIIRAMKKPIQIELLQWTGKNHREMYDFLEGEVATTQYLQTSGKNFYIDHKKIKGGLVIKTLEGEQPATIGDYIAKNITGEFYPIKEGIFKKTYNITD
jgi:hypothetical protein